MNIKKGVNIDTVIAIQTRRKAVFLWGDVQYIDAFKQKRFFKFRCYSTGEGAELPLIPHKDGYQAN